MKKEKNQVTEKIELQKQIVAIRENKCWIHDEKLITTITAPFEGFPTDEIRLMDKMYPFHGLFRIRVACL